MERSFEFKKIAATTEHIERAMRVVDACLSTILGHPILWSDRSLKTTGIQKTDRRSDIAWMVLYHLVATVEIEGTYVERGTYLSVKAIVEYVGRQGVHDPSGNTYTEALLVEKVRIEFKHDSSRREPFTFFKGSIPGISS